MTEPKHNASPPACSPGRQCDSVRKCFRDIAAALKRLETTIMEAIAPTETEQNAHSCTEEPEP